MAITALIIFIFILLPIFSGMNRLQLSQYFHYLYLFHHIKKEIYRTRDTTKTINRIGYILGFLYLSASGSLLGPRFWANPRSRRRLCTLICIYRPGPIFGFICPGPQFVVTNPGLKFVFIGPGLQFYYQPGA